MMEKLKLCDIKKPINIHIQKGISMDLNDFVDDTYGDIIDYDVYLPSKEMNLQREFVWTLEQKQELIISVIKGIELSSISVIIYRDDINQKNRNQVVKIIDGKQRVSTLIAFVKNEFPLTINNINYYHNDLEDNIKSIFNHFWFRSDRVYEYPDRLIADEDKIAWFEMINFSGTPQEKEHLNKLKIEK